MIYSFQSWVYLLSPLLLSSFNFPPVSLFLQISGLGVRKVTWNRFPIKNFQSIPLLTPIVESKHLKIAPLPRRPCYQGYNLTDAQERLRLRCVNSAFASGPVGHTWVAAIFGAIVMTQAEMTFQRNARRLIEQSAPSGSGQRTRLFLFRS